MPQPEVVRIIAAVVFGLLVALLLWRRSRRN